MTKETPHTTNSFSEYKESLKHPLRPRTVTFLLEGNKTLLGLKKRGFGAGNYLGIGGKVEEDKDRLFIDQDESSVIAHAALREVEEEIGITIASEDLESRGKVKFYFPHIADESWNQTVHIFVAQKWGGVPEAQVDDSGTVEIEPVWVANEAIPYELMWDDAQYWLPSIIEGNSVEREFLYDEHLKVVEQSLHLYDQKN